MPERYRDATYECGCREWVSGPYPLASRCPTHGDPLGTVDSGMY